MHNHYGAIDQIHILLALAIMGAYLTIPFTALRRLPVTTGARIFGCLFFTTCAITHLAIAAGFHENAWMILNDLVQAVSSIGFIYTLSSMVSDVLSRKEARARRTEP